MKIFQDRNKELEMEIDLYLNCLQMGAMTFYEGIKDFMNDNEDQFCERIKAIVEHENDADEHLKSLKFILFRYNLIPDLSADILELMDAMDDINDIAKDVLLGLQVERPLIDPSYRDEFKTIAKYSRKAVETLIKGVRIYFTQYRTIEDYISKVYHYESEVDKLLYNLKVNIFSDKDESNFHIKMHERYFAQEIAKLSDVAEAIAAKLAVFRFKRSM